jgi:hypothetical protein
VAVKWENVVGRCYIGICTRSTFCGHGWFVISIILCTIRAPRRKAVMMGTKKNVISEVTCREHGNGWNGIRGGRDQTKEKRLTEWLECTILLSCSCILNLTYYNDFPASGIIFQAPNIHYGALCLLNLSVRTCKSSSVDRRREPE